MRIVCENCSAKYSISDEKVKGKTFKIQCKKCGEYIIVRGGSPKKKEQPAKEQPAAQEQPQAAPPPMPEKPSEPPEEAEAETKVFDYAGLKNIAGEQAVWHVLVEGEQQGPYTGQQIQEYLQAGSIDLQTYIWREGFDDWAPMIEVEDFKTGAVTEPTPMDSDELPAESSAEESPAQEPGLFDMGQSEEAEEKASGGGLFDAPDTSDAPAESESTGGLFDAPAGDDGGGGLFSETGPEAPKEASPFERGADLFGGGDAESQSDGMDVFSEPREKAPSDAEQDLFASTDADSDDGGLFSSTSEDDDAASDLFGNSQSDGSEGGVFASTASEGSPRVSAEQAMTGQRHENSVLFSLANLQSLASSEPKVAGGESSPASLGEASGLIDIRALAGSIPKESEDGIDDLLSMGSGGGFSPALGAPVLAASGSSGMSTTTKIVLGSAAFLVVAAIAVVLFFVLQDKPDTGIGENDKIAALQKKIAEMESGGGSSKDIEKAIQRLRNEENKKKAAEQGKSGDKTETSVGDEDKDSSSSKKSSSRRSSSSRKKKSSSSDRDKGDEKSSSRSKSRDDGKSPKKSGKKDDILDELLGGSSTYKPPEKKKREKKELVKEASEELKPLTRSQVQKGMNSVAGRVKRCGQGQSGTVVIQVVISSTGRVTTANATGVFAGTPAGNCAARAVRSARFPKSSKTTPVKYPFRF